MQNNNISKKLKWQSKKTITEVSCSWPPGMHTPHEGFCPTPLCRSSPSHYVFEAARTFSSLHRFSMGLRSGDWLGHSKTLMCFFLSHSFIALAVCFGSLSCWNTHLRPIFNALALTVHGPVHHTFDAVQLSCPLSRKTPPKHNVSTSMFDSGDGVLWVIGSIPPLPNMRVELMPKSSILV